MYIDAARLGGFTLPEPGMKVVRFEMLAGIKLLVCRLLWALWPVTGLRIGLLFGWYW